MKNTSVISKIREPGSAVTHFIGLVLAAAASFPLIIKASHEPPGYVPAFLVYAVSLILLYGASTAYHTFDLSQKINTVLKKLDHMMIFVLIAGSYTPVCLTVIGGRTGRILLAVIWIMAAAGIIVKGFFVFCPKWFSSILYIGMGWTCIVCLKTIIENLPAAAFGWLLAGGLVYTAGGILYALKLPVFDGRHKNFGSHEIFHLFVLGGSLCHFIFLYVFVL